MIVLCAMIGLCLLAFMGIPNPATAGWSGEGDGVANVEEVRVVRPNGGEELTVGDSTTIEWSGARATDPVRLSYSSDGGATWVVIAHGATGLRYRWQVPPTLTSDARIRVELWHPQAVRLVEEYPRHIGVISGGGYNNDGSLLSTLVRRPGHPDNAEVFVWRTSPIEEIRQVSISRRDVNVIEWTPDGRRLLLAGTITSAGDTSARIVDAVSGEVVQVFRGHRDRIVSGAFSPDGSLLATGSFDLTVRIWNPSTGALIATLDSFRASVGAIAFSPDGTRMATGGGVNEGVKIWDVATWQLTAIARGDSASNRSYGAIRQLTFSPDGTKLLGATETLGGVLWNVSDARTIRYFIQRTGELLRATFSPNGRYVAGGRDSVTLWTVESGLKLLQIDAARYPLTLLDFTADGTGIVTGGRDSTPRVFSLTGEAFVEDRSDRSFGIGMPADARDAEHEARHDVHRIARTDNALVIDLDASETRDATARLIDVRGRLVEQRRSDGGGSQLLIPISDLPLGCYILMFECGNVRLFERVMISR